MVIYSKLAVYDKGPIPYRRASAGLSFVLVCLDKFKWWHAIQLYGLYWVICDIN